jgi:1,4-dihydroxy-6-naphthoate synthase
MKLTLGFSPCPNDTFIFDALVNKRIDTEGLDFDFFLADIVELNSKALNSKVDITKMSLYAYAFAADNYLILDSGSALGYGNGPLLISRSNLGTEELNNARIAIPGHFTTANLLLSIFWPDAKNKIEYLFSDIDKSMVRGEVDAGLIIHETRFTYHKKGLIRIADLGEYWENLTSMPVPLGTIVIRRSLPEEVILKVNRIIQRSLDYAYTDSMASFDFVTQNARELESQVLSNHIKLFVNSFTDNLGPEGKQAIKKLLEIARERDLIPELPEKIFVTA